MKIGIVGKSRYIDSETALQIIDKYAKTVTSDGKVVVDAIRDIVGVITPTADVVEVRHGEWAVKDLNNSLYESKKAPHCSVCNYMSFIRYDYCPNCGAKMDEEREEGKK